MLTLARADAPVRPPEAHWSKLALDDPPERFNEEIGQRTDLFGKAGGKKPVRQTAGARADGR